jgi:beta-N-acetylhexosaminidase
MSTGRMRELDHLTLPERVGQLFVLGFQGTSPDADTLKRFGRMLPGGLALSQRNIDNLDQLYGLASSLGSMGQIPPLLAIEQEGGAVDRLRRAVAPMPSLGDLADAGTLFVRSGARLLAAELQAAGLNTALSPILDLGLAGSVYRARSLASGAGEVTRLARIQLDEFHRKGLLCCGSHFPGLGGATRDPHFVLPRIRRARKELISEDIAPFRELATELDMIRVSHAHYPTLGDLRPLPASLSARIVGGLLREEIGFGGVVMTDDLTLGAITSRGLTAGTFLDAIQAGNDLLFFSQSTPLVEEAYDLVVRTATRNAGIRHRVETSSARILRLKQKLALTAPPNRAHARSRLIRQIARLRNSISPVERIQVH